MLATKQTFAVLLPITSRGCNEKQLECNISAFLESLVNGHDYSRMQLCLYVGVDVGDSYFAPWSGKEEPVKESMSSKGLDYVRKLVRDLSPLQLKIHQYSTTEGNVCYIWRSLAKHAWQDECDYYVLLGDDVEIHTKGWASVVQQAFERTSRDRALPFGFGCVALYDNTFPFFPSFPVVHKIHMDAFRGEIFPPIFFNQDADPYLYELYKRWDASVFAEVRLTNGIGGSGSVETRYQKKHVDDWTHQPLANGVNRLGEYLKENGFDDDRRVVMDVVVPTFRCNLSYLDRIVNLRSDKTVTTFILIVDHPDPRSKAVLNLVSHFSSYPRTRLRVVVNERNLGAAATRTRGFYESWADYILFLDDDVKPDKEILSQYAAAIVLHPEASGFVGSSIVPDPKETEHFRMAAVLCYIIDWWTIAQRVTNPPWGITANLVTRRYQGMYMDHTFTGGEDIDLCLRLRERAPLVSVSNAVVHHDWWKPGADYGHFAHWAHGDGRLLDVHALHSYRDVFDAVETMILLLLITLLSLLFGRLSFATSCLATCACIWILEGIFFLWYHNDDTRVGFCNRSCGEKLIITAHAVLLTFAVQLGRIHGHWDRLDIRFFKHFGHRFDWSAGTDREFVGKMRTESSLRFALYLVCFCTLVVVI